MSDASNNTVIQLFRKWRTGDEACGQEMAQRFSDWYYAISTIRIPGTEGRPPMEAACQQFAQGIITVTRPRALVDWAHDLLERELAAAGYSLDTKTNTGSDNPNAMTRNRSPQELLQTVAPQIEPELLRVLALAYDPSVPLKTVDDAAEPLGGTPFAMLQARYSIKRALRNGQDVPFAVAPDVADMDRAPISLYEAHRLASGREMAELEKWLLSDIELCKDIAEFSAFVHALRGGALAEYAVAPSPPAEPVTPEAPPTTPAPAPATPAPAPAPATDATPEAPPAPAPAPETEPVPPAKRAAEQAPTPSPQPAPESIEAEKPAVPAATNAPQPAQSKGGSMRSMLYTAAVAFCAMVLLIMIIFAVLRG
jgi:hypothetical protein